MKICLVNPLCSVEFRANGFRCNDSDIMQNKETKTKLKLSTEARACGLGLGEIRGQGERRVSIIDPRVYGQFLVP